MSMHSPYLRIGAAAKVLGEMENIFQKKGSQNQEWIFPVRQHSDVLLYVNFIQENTFILGSTCNEGDQQPFINIPITINETAKNKFMAILSRAIKAHEGISRQERLFVHRFWSEIQRLTLLGS